MVCINTIFMVCIKFVYCGAHQQSLQGTELLQGICSFEWHHLAFTRG